ncbi:MAG TPA: hypothetical protein VMN39_03905 [Longimicrobiaceae bacterium]|nr:hypothetical protein [Longimicrobiaceae bacterium]
MKPRWTASLGAMAVCAQLVGCNETLPTGSELAAGTLGTQAADKKLDLDVCSPGAGGFTTASTNPYFPLAVGDRWHYLGEEDDVAVELLITVLDMTRTIDGVTTRIVEEREWEDDELLEVSWNYFVQAGDGTICYFGEDVDIFEDEEISHEGAWCADDAGNAPGIIMPADPRPGMTYQNELAPGIAEDAAKIVGIGPITVPAGTFTETIRVRESNPLDGDKGYKVFAAGTGLIVDEVLKLESYAHGAAAPGPPIPTDQTCGI